MAKASLTEQAYGTDTVLQTDCGCEGFFSLAAICLPSLLGRLLLLVCGLYLICVS